MDQHVTAGIWIRTENCRPAHVYVLQAAQMNPTVFSHRQREMAVAGLLPPRWVEQAQAWRTRKITKQFLTAHIHDNRNYSS